MTSRPVPDPLSIASHIQCRACGDHVALAEPQSCRCGLTSVEALDGVTYRYSGPADPTVRLLVHEPEHRRMAERWIVVSDSARVSAGAV